LQGEEDLPAQAGPAACRIILSVAEELLEVIRRKMQAMKEADLPAMQALTRREHKLIERIQEREGCRRQLLDVLGEELGFRNGSGRAVNVSQLADRLPDSCRRTLEHTARALRDVVVKVAQANRVAGAMSREVIHHLTWVFAAARPRAAAPVGYGDNGAPVAAEDAALLDAVG
ncbi:MAG: hypothetical protein D6788_04535, partial [Planctomycetota bacterium]